MENQLKIRINQSEVYTMSFEKEELSSEEFFGLLERLKEIEKVVSKGNVGFSSGKMKRDTKSKGIRRGSRFSWNNDRAKFIEVLKVYYFGKKEDKEKVCKQENATWDEISKSVFYLRKKKFNTQPKEIGLKYFPNNRGKHREQSLEQAREAIRPKTKTKPKKKLKNGHLGKEYNDKE